MSTNDPSSGLIRPTYAGPPPTVTLHPQPIILPRRVWELPLAILLWVYLALGVLVVLLLLVGGIGLAG